MIYRNVDIRSQARWSSRKSWLPSVDPAFSFHLQAPSINKSPYADRKPMKGLLTASIGPSVGWWVLVLKGARYWPFIVSPIPSSWHREFSLVLSILQQTKFPWTSRSTNIEVHSAGKIEWWLIKEDVVVDVLCLVVLNTIAFMMRTLVFWNGGIVGWCWWSVLSWKKSRFCMWKQWKKIVRTSMVFVVFIFIL